MVLTNAEKQARWRERHIAKRRDAQRIVNLLVRKSVTDAHVKQVAGLLNMFLNRHGVRLLRQALKALTEPTAKEMATRHRDNEKAFRDWWLCEHPGRTAKEYNRLRHDDDGEVQRGRGACLRARPSRPTISRA